MAVKEEVEHSVEVVVNLHKKWLDLAASASHGDEFEWTSSELLSGLRSIEWDLQDLEDTVSIVESNRQKFQLDEAELLVRSGEMACRCQQAVRACIRASAGAQGLYRVNATASHAYARRGAVGYVWRRRLDGMCHIEG